MIIYSANKLNNTVESTVKVGSFLCAMAIQLILIYILYKWGGLSEREN